MSNRATDELPFTEDTIFHVVEPDGATRIHRSLDGLAQDLNRIFDQDGREVFYQCDVDAWDLLDIEPITEEMAANDQVPRGESWGYAAHLKEDGEVVEEIEKQDFEKLMLLVTCFLEDGDDRSAKVAALKMEHIATLDKPGLLQTVKEEVS